MFITEILQRKLLLMNLVHRRTTIRNSPDLVSIKFFPINGLSFTTAITVGHHFGFQGIRFLKPCCVSIAALLPRPEGIGDSLYRFTLFKSVSHGIPMGGSPLATFFSKKKPKRFLAQTPFSLINGEFPFRINNTFFRF